MRITTSMMIGNYQSHLSSAALNYSKSQNSVLSQRNFNSYADDPSSAIRAANLERKYAKNEDYKNLVTDVQSRLDAQESAMQGVLTYAKEISKDNALRALNGTNAEQREVFAASIRSLQKSLLSNMNTAYGDSFLLAGADGKNAPFNLSEDGKTLTYRGIDVSTGLDASGNPANPSLETLSKESILVDMGFGFTSAGSGSILPSTAFDMALPGINIVGYGKDSEGMDKNIILLAGQLADELEKEPFDDDKFRKILGAFDKSTENTSNQETNLGVKSAFLEQTKSRLDDNEVTLATQIDKIVQPDMAVAISNYSYSQYVYNTALRVGVNILSQSFIDFMK